MNEAVCSGAKVYYKTKDGGLHYTDSYGYRDAWNEGQPTYFVAIGHYAIAEGIIYVAGEFIQYEAYLSSGQKPTEGKYEDGYYYLQGCIK